MGILTIESVAQAAAALQLGSLDLLSRQKAVESEAQKIISKSTEECLRVQER